MTGSPVCLMSQSLMSPSWAPASTVPRVPLHRTWAAPTLKGLSHEMDLAFDDKYG